ncbi:MAG: DinB family protein [Bacteroidetes bacterium]|nr:DinB family protein [Bacteroidota bacterium]
MPLSNSILSRLQYQHQTISELVAGLNEDALKHQINPGKWSAFENIAHLTAYQPTFITRINKINEGNSPVFERYVAENDPLFYDYLKKPLAELLQISDADRKIIIRFFSSLNENDLSKSAQHPKYGNLDMGQWLQFFLLHEAHHLWVILQLVCNPPAKTKR